LLVVANPSTGASSTLKAEFKGSSDLPANTTIILSAMPQKAAVPVTPLTQQSGGTAELSSRAPGSWS
jgi:hypothetical protein